MRIFCPTFSKGLIEKRKGQKIRIYFRDRKSTRLNSSHLVISYAVFCLKKKKILAFLLASILAFASTKTPPPQSRSATSQCNLYSGSDSIAPNTRYHRCALHRLIASPWH